MGPPARPAVSVVVPFLGDERAALQTLTHLLALDLGDDDEAIVADNTAAGVAGPVVAEAARVVRAAAEQSSYHARNAGARAASCEWLLFVDADCVPAPGLLANYFAPRPGESCGALAGSIAGVSSQGGLLARYARSRNFFDQRDGLHAQSGLAAATGNLMVRRAAFETVGGFAEGIHSAGDVDFCLRLGAAGWVLEHRPEAVVEHYHREELRSFLAMIARYGAGARWLERRYPGTSPRWPLGPGLAGSARDVAANLARGRLEEASFRAIDALGLLAHNLGYRRSNELTARQ